MTDGLASQRIVELLLELLLSDRGRTKAELRTLSGYSHLDDMAFGTAFQRDKDILASVGVHVSIGKQVPPRYRVDHMPDGPTLEPADVALAGQAVGAWQQANATTSSAIMFKLLALTPEDVESYRGVPTAYLEGDERVFQPLLEALRTGQQVRFEYQKLGGNKESRLVRPARLVLSGAGTYLQGFDLHRNGTRLFRLSRILGGVDLVQPTVADTASTADALDPDTSPIDLISPTVWVRESSPAAQTMGQWSDPVPGHAPEGWQRRAGVAAWRGTWVRRILAHGTDMVPVGPPSFVRYATALVQQADHA